MFFAQPKCASTRLRSWVANATFMEPPALRVSSMGHRRGRRIRRGWQAQPPRVGGRLTVVLLIGDDHVGDVENQVPCAAVADQELMAGAQPVEHRKACPIER